MPPTSQPRPPAAANLSNTNRTSSGSSRSAFISRGMAVTIIPTMVESDTSPDDGEGLPAAPLNRGRDPQFRRGFNPATWYTVLGIVLLAATFWIPITTANRTARVEGRADALAEVLLLEAMASAPLDFQDPATAAMIYGRLVRRAATQNIYVDDLELLPAQPDIQAITLRNKHYVVQLRPSPQAAPNTLQDQELPPESLPLEVLAWPVRSNGPGHGAFFYPEDAEPAFTRNLQFGYHGLEPPHWPRPGHTHRRPDANDPWHYRDFDDERWLLHARPVRRPAGP